MARTIFSLLLSALFGFSARGQKVLYYDVGKPHSPKPVFSFVHLTDVHIGEGYPDYGTAGWVDEPPSGDEGYSAERLRKAVDWINRNADSLGIDLVMVTGDLTDSGEKSEFLKCHEILDALNVPYIPTIGNHDVWPYTRFAESHEASGDRFFAEVFDAVLRRNSSRFSPWDDGTRMQRVSHPLTGQVHQFQNFAFTHKGCRFIITDFGTRRHAGKGEPGVGPSADLHDFTGGSFSWFSGQMKSLNEDFHAVFVFSHWPLMKEPIRFHYAFDLKEYRSLVELMFPFREKLSAWFSGHIHRSFSQNVTLPGQGEPIIRCVETSANKQHKNGYLRVVRIW